MSLFDIDNLIHLKECFSTNDYLISLNKKSNCKEGTVVSTDFQTKGRGQRNNVWFSQKDSNLTFSFIIQPSLPISYQFYLNIFTSLSVYHVLKTILGEKIGIKWPNDLLYSEDKIAGILVENIISGNKIQKSIIGIGINVNQKKFPIQNATSIINILSNRYKREDLLIFVFKELEKHYNLLINKKFNLLYANYFSALYNINQQVFFLRKNKTYNGIIKGINTFGRLKVKVDKKIKLFSYGEIKFLKSNYG